MSAVSAEAACWRRSASQTARRFTSVIFAPCTGRDAGSRPAPAAPTSGASPRRLTCPASETAGQVSSQCRWSVPGAAVDGGAPADVVGGAVAVLAFATAAARRHPARARAVPAAGPADRPGTAPSSSREHGGTAANAPGTTRSAVPAARPATSAGSRAPGTRPGGRQRRQLRRRAISSGSSACPRQPGGALVAQRRRRWCRGRSRGTRLSGTTCGPAADAPPASPAPGSPDPSPPRPGTPGPDPGQPRGRAVQHDAAQHVGRTPRPRERRRRRGQREPRPPVTMSVPAAHAGWAPGPPRPAAGPGRGAGRPASRTGAWCPRMSCASSSAPPASSRFDPQAWRSCAA